MALEKSQVSRNLNARPMFMGLEMEDFMIVMGASVGANLIGHYVLADMPIMGIQASWALMLFVGVTSIPGLMILKYGKPRGYTADLFDWFRKPKAYCCLERDPVQTTPYIKDEE